MGHPVEPEATAATIDMVAADLHVDRPVQFDPGHFATAEPALDVNVMDLVIRDLAENAAQAADNSGLFTVRDSVAADPNANPTPGENHEPQQDFRGEPG